MIRGDGIRALLLGSVVDPLFEHLDAQVGGIHLDMWRWNYGFAVGVPSWILCLSILTRRSAASTSLVPVTGR
jgi:hypothetical protein